MVMKYNLSTSNTHKTVHPCIYDGYDDNVDYRQKAMSVVVMNAHRRIENRNPITSFDEKEIPMMVGDDLNLYVDTFTKKSTNQLLSVIQMCRNNGITVHVYFYVPSSRSWELGYTIQA